MQTRLKATSLAIAIGLAFGVSTAHADERTELETLRQTTLNLIQILVQQGVLKQDQAEGLIKARIGIGEAR